MKIKLIKLNFDDENVYKYKPMSFCCDKLKNNPLIGIVADEYCENENDITYPDIPQMCLCCHDEWTEYGEDMEEDTYYPIELCPFCGEKIQYELVAEEDVDKEYQRLSRERDILFKGAQVTDSKSKEKDLREKVRELDKKIQYLYEIGEYKEGYLDN